MGDRDDIYSRLQTGSWKTSRSRSPNPYDRSPLSSQSSQSYSSDARGSRSGALPRRSKGPPPPSVEDEADSLAREHSPSIVTSLSDEEPKYRGEIDQYPILKPVAEHNPERRFVIVTNSDTGVDDSENTSDPEQSQRPRAPQPEHDDNTCKQYILVTPSDDTREPKKKPGLAKRKSHQELPRLDTDVQDGPPSIKRSSSRRHREKVVVDQAPRESARPTDDAFLSPVVTHTAGGRDRAYLDFSAGGNRSPAGRGSARDDPRASKADGRRSAHPSSSSPTLPRRKSSVSGTRPSLDPLAGFGYGNADDAMAYMTAGAAFAAASLPRGERKSESPTKTRKSNSPPYPSTSRDRIPERPAERPAGRRSRRPSNAREQGEYYGSETLKSSRSDRSERFEYSRQNRTGTESETLLRPIPIGRSAPKGPSPLPSPRASQGSLFQDTSPLPSPMDSRSPKSSTFPYPSDRPADRNRPDEYAVSSSTPAGRSPPRRVEEVDRGSRPRAPSRAASIPNGATAASTGAPSYFSRGGAVDRRPLPPARAESQDPNPPGPYWQPGSFDPERQGYLSSSAPTITSLRRYSEDVQQGVLPQLPECRWIVPATPRSKSGGTQFVTLPGAEKFIVCPDCYSGVFAGIDEFKRLFIPALIRSPDQPISCDFGSSPWYRIAFLMTLKNRYADLRLLEAVASVAARNLPCPGNQPASRIWYSMIDPRSRRPIQSFIVCPGCVGMVSALLPNLAGIFSPLDPYSTQTRSICGLHFAPERKRFLDYFDLMETASDTARRGRGVPNLQELADKVRAISLIAECQRNAPIPNRQWHAIDSLPEFTVCEECYDAIVWPMLEDDNNTSEVPQHFIRTRQPRALASCQLYSNRMREVFWKACRRNDVGYLQSKVKEKLALETEYLARYSGLMQMDQSDPNVQRDRQEVIMRLKEIE